MQRWDFWAGSTHCWLVCGLPATRNPSPSPQGSSQRIYLPVRPHVWDRSQIPELWACSHPYENRHVGVNKAKNPQRRIPSPCKSWREIRTVFGRTMQRRTLGAAGEARAGSSFPEGARALPFPLPAAPPRSGKAAHREGCTPWRAPGALRIGTAGLLDSPFTTHIMNAQG